MKPSKLKNKGIKMMVEDARVLIEERKERGEIMKHQSYDWLLVGCHLITEVAVAYYPHYAHNSSAVKSFRRVLRENSLLSQELADAGYTLNTTHVTPIQTLFLYPNLRKIECILMH